MKFLTFITVKIKEIGINQIITIKAEINTTLNALINFV